MTIKNHIGQLLDALLMVAIVIMLMTYTSQALSQVHPTGPLSSIGEEVVRIENDPDAGSRYEAMRRVVFYLRHDNSRTTEGDVMALARLLKDSNDLVRDRAAVALGLIGPKASRAVPALQAALSEVECVRAEQNSRFAIAIALRRIGVSPTPPDCVATENYGLEAREGPTRR